MAGQGEWVAVDVFGGVELWQFDLVQARIAALNKRTTKLGLGAVAEIVEVAQSRRTVEKPAFEDWPTRVAVEVVDVQVKHRPVVFPGGWRLRGVVELHQVEQGYHNVVHTAAGEEPDQAWRTAGDNCTHCERENNGRNKLVAVTNDAGQDHLVGSSCMKPFLGFSALQGLMHLLAERPWESLSNSEDDAEPVDGRPPAKDRYQIRITDYLSTVVVVIAAYGWVSRTNAGGYVTATADEAIRACYNREAANQLDDEKPLSCTDEWVAGEVEAALGWVANVDDSTTNEYLQNCAAIGSRDYCTSREVGLVASWIVAARKDQARSDAAKAAEVSRKRLSGEPKDRVAIDMMVLRVVHEPGGGYQHRGGEPGDVWKVTAVSGDGERIFWKTSTNPQLEEGDRMFGKATIKQHRATKPDIAPDGTILKPGGDPYTVVLRFRAEEIPDQTDSPVVQRPTRRQIVDGHDEQPAIGQVVIEQPGGAQLGLGL